MLDKYKMDTHVTSFDVGPTRKLKYSMILRYLQEAAERQLESEELSYKTMRDQGIVFLLTRVNIEIKALPMAGESIGVETWFRALKGAQFVRDVRITGAHGETLVEEESLWITVDPESHKIIRPSAFPFTEIMRPYEGDEVNVPARKIKVADMENEWETKVREVRWSDIDCNGHMNNAVYADLVCDYYPSGLGSQELRYFSISFIGEALEGAEIAIKSAITSSGEAIYEGKCGEKRCFEAIAGCQ